jgi:hypothetical protein
VATKPQLSNNNYLIVLALITLLVVGGAVIGGKMLFSTIVRDTKVVLAKQKANEQLERNVTAAPDLIRHYQDLGGQQALIASALPNDADLPGLIGLMENMTSVAGVTMKSIGPSTNVAVVAAPAASEDGTVVVNDKPQTYAFAMSLEGSYAAFQTLLQAMEQSARPMRVNAMQMSGSASSLSIVLDATTYYQDKATLPIRMEEIK